MKCEICGVQTATMWVEVPVEYQYGFSPKPLVPKPLVSCDDCGPQAGYKILAPLVANIRSDD